MAFRQTTKVKCYLTGAIIPVDRATILTLTDKVGQDLHGQNAIQVHAGTETCIALAKQGIVTGSAKTGFTALV